MLPQVSPVETLDEFAIEGIGFGVLVIGMILFSELFF
jgi:hypothetical protein